MEVKLIARKIRFNYLFSLFICPLKSYKFSECTNITGDFEGKNYSFI